VAASQVAHHQVVLVEVVLGLMHQAKMAYQVHQILAEAAEQVQLLRQMQVQVVLVL
jgi:hypothetical protein